ncbi:retention module-containing protein [Massilia sp. B-10]|nr:retention module-containing protein [Massilia sp. B-10]
MANAGNIIGNVTVLVGHATVRSTDGSVRTLQLGDAIHEGDVIVTEDGGKVEIAFNDGHSYILGGNETLTVDAQVYAPAATATHDAALLPATGELADVTQAIISGKGSLDELLEETAACLSGGGDDNGSSFVELLRITETLTPVENSTTTADTETRPQFETVNGSAIMRRGHHQRRPARHRGPWRLLQRHFHHRQHHLGRRRQHCHAAGAGQRSGHRRRGRHRRHQCGRQLPAPAPTCPASRTAT